MVVKTIKDINEDDWAEFKSLAAKNDMNMGKFFGFLVESYKSDDEIFWDTILNGKKRMTDKEAKELEDFVKKSRKELRFRESARF